MELEMRMLEVRGMEWDDKTYFEGGVLYVDKREALEACGSFPAIGGFDLHVARPGENVRIIPVKSVALRAHLESASRRVGRTLRRGEHRLQRLP